MHATIRLSRSIRNSVKKKNCPIIWNQLKPFRINVKIPSKEVNARLIERVNEAWEALYQESTKISEWCRIVVPTVAAADLG